MCREFFLLHISGHGLYRFDEFVTDIFPLAMRYAGDEHFWILHIGVQTLELALRHPKPFRYSTFLLLASSPLAIQSIAHCYHLHAFHHVCERFFSLTKHLLQRLIQSQICNICRFFFIDAHQIIYIIGNGVPAGSTFPIVLSLCAFGFSGICRNLRIPIVFLTSSTGHPVLISRQLLVTYRARHLHDLLVRPQF